MTRARGDATSPKSPVVKPIFRQCTGSKSDLWCQIAGHRSQRHHYRLILCARVAQRHRWFLHRTPSGPRSPTPLNFDGGLRRLGGDIGHPRDAADPNGRRSH